MQQQPVHDMSVLLITHDLGVVAELAQRAVVMYAGKIAECADVVDIFERPAHPYTAGLLLSVPKVDAVRQELRPIKGSVPDALRFPSGCRFHPRCLFRMPICPKEEPPLGARPAPGQLAACFYTEEQPDANLLTESVSRSLEAETNRNPIEENEPPESAGEESA
jgi:oligopeptide/dipeptide ABC transporter ATP-binding protein